MKYLFLIIGLFLSIQVDAQFRLVSNGTPSWTVVDDSTYTAFINFQADLTGNSYLATNITTDMRIFTGLEETFRVDSVWNQTFSSADIRVVEYYESELTVPDHGSPSGQVMVYDPDNKKTVPAAPFGSTGSTAQLQAAIVSYNAKFDDGGVAGQGLTQVGDTIDLGGPLDELGATSIYLGNIDIDETALTSDPYFGFWKTKKEYNAFLADSLTYTIGFGLVRTSNYGVHDVAMINKVYTDTHPDEFSFVDVLRGTSPGYVFGYNPAMGDHYARIGIEKLNSTTDVHPVVRGIGDQGAYAYSFPSRPPSAGQGLIMPAFPSSGVWSFNWGNVNGIFNSANSGTRVGDQGTMDIGAYYNIVFSDWLTQDTRLRINEDTLGFYDKYGWVNATPPADGQIYMHGWQNGSPNFFAIDTSGVGVSGDNWGGQVVQSDATLSGDGTLGSPLTAFRLYEQDGSLTSDRTVTMGLHDLSFIGTNSGNQFRVQTEASPGSANFEMNVFPSRITLLSDNSVTSEESRFDVDNGGITSNVTDGTSTSNFDIQPEKINLTTDTFDISGATTLIGFPDGDGQGINLADNGLSTTTSGSDTTVILGGTLTQNTDIELGDNHLHIVHSGEEPFPGIVIPQEEIQILDNEISMAVIRDGTLASAQDPGANRSFSIQDDAIIMNLGDDALQPGETGFQILQVNTSTGELKYGGLYDPLGSDGIYSGSGTIGGGMRTWATLFNPNNNAFKLTTEVLSDSLQLHFGDSEIHSSSADLGFQFVDGNTNDVFLFSGLYGNAGPTLQGWKTQYFGPTQSWQFYLDNIEMGMKTDSVDFAFQVFSGGNSVTFEDNRAVKRGIEYAADYSSDFTPLSLVTKQYVDAQLGGGGSDGNGIYSGSDTLSGDTEVYLNDNDFHIRDTFLSTFGFLQTEQIKNFQQTRNRQIMEERSNYYEYDVTAQDFLPTDRTRSRIQVFGGDLTLSLSGNGGDDSNTMAYEYQGINFNDKSMIITSRDSATGKDDLGMDFYGGRIILYSNDTLNPSHSFRLGEDGLFIDDLKWPDTPPTANQVLSEGAVDDDILEWVTVSGSGNSIYNASGTMFPNGVATLADSSNTFTHTMSYNGDMSLKFGPSSYKQADVAVGFESDDLVNDYLFAGIYKSLGDTTAGFAVNYDISGGGDFGIQVDSAGSSMNGVAGSIAFRDTATIYTATVPPGSRYGIQYADDYSADFTPRSLVDKAYVDGVAGGGGSNFYNADGSLSGNRFITGGGFNVDFDNTGTFEIDASQFQVRNSAGLIRFPTAEIPGDVVSEQNLMVWTGTGSPGAATPGFINPVDIVPTSTASKNWTTRSADTGANVVLDPGQAFIFDAAGSGGWTEDWDTSNLRDGDMIRVKFFGSTGADAITIDPVSGNVIHTSSSTALNTTIDCGDCDVEFIWSGSTLYVFE